MREATTRLVSIKVPLVCDDRGKAFVVIVLPV